MKSVKKYIFSMICAATALFFGCQDKQWDEHNKISDADVSGSLLEALQNNPQCSNFYEAVIKSGYGDFLAQDVSFTVLVPDNNAWQGVDMNNEAALKKIVSNHIAYGRFLDSNPELRQHLQMINTKVIRYDEQNHFNGAKITLPDQPAGNGVFHVIDKIIDVRMNIWEYVSSIECEQINFIHSINHQEMDTLRSIKTGIDAMGRPIYDPVWVNVNNFLRATQLDNENEEFTYLVLSDDGFEHLYNKYHPFCVLTTDEKTDSLTRFNVCRDFVFKGISDITQFDTLTNILGVKVPVKNVNIQERYDASNGRVYLIDKSDILLREKIKPVLIEGENYNRSYNNHYVFVRNRTWASNLGDIVMSDRASQSEQFIVPNIMGEDSIVTLTHTFLSIGDRGGGNGVVYANATNFWVEFKAQVYSTGYKIHYLAYDDMSEHIRNVNISRAGTSTVIAQVQHIYRPEQKLFVSMPGRPVLRRGSETSSIQIANNYLGNATCFVALDTAGIKKERVMRQWRLNNEDARQDINEPIVSDNAEIMQVDRTGLLTIWLCNTTRSNATGPLFLDYIKLVPVLPEE